VEAGDTLADSTHLNSPTVSKNASKYKAIQVWFKKAHTGHNLHLNTSRKHLKVSNASRRELEKGNDCGSNNLLYKSVQYHRSPWFLTREHLLLYKNLWPKRKPNLNGKWTSSCWNSRLCCISEGNSSGDTILSGCL